MKKLLKEILLGVIVLIIVTGSLLTLITSTETWATLTKTVVPLAIAAIIIIRILDGFKGND